MRLLPRVAQVRLREEARSDIDAESGFFGRDLGPFPGLVDALHALLGRDGLAAHEADVLRGQLLDKFTRLIVKRVLEQDVGRLVEGLLPTTPKENIPLEIEKLIRAYDPCMSCASHFLKVDWQ